MAEVKPSTSRVEDAVELVGEASCSGADRFSVPESVPSAIAAESPSFLTWIWIQILTACSGVWGARGGGLSGSRMSGLASGAQHSLEDNEREVLSRIAPSMSTWSEIPGRSIHPSVSIPCPSERLVWEELKASSPHFFSDDKVEDLQLGRKIGEGSQGQIFEAKWEGSDSDLVLKVFKLNAGFSLADLKRLWPRSTRRDGEDCNESRALQGRSSKFVFEDAMSNYSGLRCFIMAATLLRDGRFAFLMRRYWGDLRTAIDLEVEANTHPWGFDFLSQPLFSFKDSILNMLKIAMGMQGLHREGVLHRDLKAANVLIGRETDGSMLCHVADYECAMFVQGTGFWRAPEVLQEILKKEELLKKEEDQEEDRNDEIWTEKVDVYSFGMTCYEILTGQSPFYGYSKSKWDDVIKGERPFLPDYVRPALRELVEACWHAQPPQRPSFDVIVRQLNDLLDVLL